MVHFLPVSAVIGFKFNHFNGVHHENPLTFGLPLESFLLISRLHVSGNRFIQQRMDSSGFRICFINHPTDPDKKRRPPFSRTNGVFHPRKESDDLLFRSVPAPDGSWCDKRAARHIGPGLRDAFWSDSLYDPSIHTSDIPDPMPSYTGPG